MSEVIDLVSSSPDVSSKSLPSQPAARKTSLNLSTLVPNISSDDFDFPVCDDPFGRTPKRLRLSPTPTPVAEESKEASSKKDPFLTFLSDADPSFLSDNERERDTDARKKKTYTWEGEESDPIVFTSSAPEPAVHTTSKRSSTNKTSTILIDDDIDDPPLTSDPFDKFLNPDKSDNALSERTVRLLAEINERSKEGTAKQRKKTTRSITPDISASKGKSRPGKPKNCVQSDEDSLDDPVKKPKRPAKLSAAEKEARAQERQEAKARREQERELEKERKRKLKEQKAKEKQIAADIAEVNKVKLDKKVSTPEMIVDLSTSFEETRIGTQVGEYMKQLGVEKTFFGSRIPNIVKWRRKVTANYNDEAGRWEPCSLEIRPEGHVLCFLPAQDFVDMVAADAASVDSTALENHVLKIQGSYPGCKRIYLIEGLTAWMRKNKNSRNRSYQAAVKRQMEQDSPSENATSSQPTGRRRKTKKPDAPPPIDENLIEDALLQLQVAHSCLIHHTAAQPESAEWIKNFTEHVSTIPYRQERMNFNDAAFCMEVGQVKSGEDNADTFIKMLQEVHRLTAPVAYGIAAHYPTVTALVNGMKVKGPLMLEDVKVSFSPLRSIIQLSPRVILVQISLS